ncbi:hypothetical protein D3C71_2029920 [compost metagenome]
MAQLGLPDDADGVRAQTGYSRIGLAALRRVSGSAATLCKQEDGSGIHGDNLRGDSMESMIKVGAGLNAVGKLVWG